MSNERQSSKVPSFEPRVPSNLMSNLSESDKYLFEKIDIIMQGQTWQSDKIYDIQTSINNIDTDVLNLKVFKEECETSLSVKKAVMHEKTVQSRFRKRFVWPAGGLFLAILYPAYLEAYSDLGGKLIIRGIIETLLP